LKIIIWVNHLRYRRIVKYELRMKEQWPIFTYRVERCLLRSGEY